MVILVLYRNLCSNWLCIKTYGLRYMDNLTNKEQKQLDYLLIDYGAIKSEIARRSNLQRVVLAAYIAVVALVAKEAYGATLTSLFIISLWLSAALSLNFYHREGMEIIRLGKISTDKIASTASNIIGVSPKALLPSQTDSGITKIDNITKDYDRQFNWVLFFIIPIGITIFYLSQDWSRLENISKVHTRAPYIAVMTLISGLWTTKLLTKYYGKK